MALVAGGEQQVTTKRTNARTASQLLYSDRDRFASRQVRLSTAALSLAIIVDIDYEKGIISPPTPLVCIYRGAATSDIRTRLPSHEDGTQEV